MDKIQKLKKFVEHVDELVMELSDQSTDYMQGKTNKIDQHNITISLDNKEISIPFSADSYELLLSLIQQEIDYMENN